jgi:hypothetical protein
MIAHCLFEQSGTFRNCFRKLGIEAYDYDILNDFGQTDHVIDLFSEIQKGYDGEPSIFDNISSDDLIMAFYPCTRFECQCQMLYSGNAFQQKKWDLKKKMEYDIKLHNELHELYIHLCQLVWIAEDRGLKLIIENPWTQPHYLQKYWAFEPTMVDKDRTQRGDYYKKVTAFWFVNCKPQNNLVNEELEPVETKRIEFQKHEDGVNRKTLRSMIHPQYARRFIKEFILEQE